ncbi:PAS domain-containing hybrid sensor histidine kinase/response regulator [Phenylobacterium sp.]|jgi:PAS domain S-box-containing protein|uniref:PAS domain-containing hybrid sensor histidine kinase/response regulator n=1 Tax=Phenylobacterium sp. TaxID=1871053 RepID=UPI002F9376D3
MGTPVQTEPSAEFERRVDQLLDGLPFPVFRTDLQGVTRHANAAAEALFQLGRSTFEGRPYDQPPIEVSQVDGSPIEFADTPVPKALRGQEVRDFEINVRIGGGELKRICFDGSPLRDPQGRIAGALVAARDVTAQRAAEDALKMSERRLNAVFDNTRMAVFLMDERQHCVYANSAAEALTGYSFSEMQGRPLHDVVHHTRPDGRPYPLEECPIDRAFPEDNQTEGEEIFVHADGSFYPVAFTASPLRDEASKTVGTVIEVRPIADERTRERQLREGREFLRELLNSTGEAFYAVDRDGVTTLVNPAFLQLLGFADESQALGRKLHGIIHHTHADGRHYEAEDCPIYKAANEGVPAHVEGELFYRLDGSAVPVEYRAQPIVVGGELRGAICTFFDISDRLAAQREIEEKTAALEEQTRALRVLNAASAAISGDLDLERVVQTVTDAAVELTGAEFGAFFYNVLDEAGGRYTLYTISGVPREAFSKFPMPRNTAVFQPTFEGTGVMRSDDITKDPRYGHSAPHHGMPAGHLPVRSYLAVPVRSRDGEVLGGLFFGHSQPGMFSALDEERIVGLAGQAAIAIDNARLFQASQWELEARRRAEADLQALNARLEERVASEVAERTKAEAALRQAQKMEAIGQLTGGVAHDFNNLLTVIMGGLDTIRRSAPEDVARIRRAVDMATKGAERAASLTSRLLAFSRRQPLAPKPLELNAVVRDMTDLLHRTLGEQIELEGVLAPRLWQVEVDQNQLESAILNLAVNARDAMPDGGKLTIETANTALDETYAALDAEVVPGQYAVISVSDTGCGMDKATLAKVFEPFFTTKEVGRGTGLGLSMVYGFVKQSGGHVTLYSEEGQGTTVKLYFPRFKGAAAVDERPAVAETPRASKGEVVLLVEDNEDVRAYSALILTELGYVVREAGDADAALQVLRSPQRIDLLFTDVVLPGDSGRVLADEASRLRPGLKVLYTTGYSRNAIVHHGRLDAGVELISKPFTFEQLAVRVRDLLDRPAAARPPS